MRKARTDKKVPPYTPCGYCFEEFAVVWDHLVPVSAGGGNEDSNLFPACWRCNALLSGKLFASIEHKRDYLMSLPLEKRKGTYKRSHHNKLQKWS